jgi:hypothetical protein
MNINKQQFIEWQASPVFRSWFLSQFPEGEADYQDVLNALAEDDLPDEAHWLMDNAGRDDAGQLDINGSERLKHIFSAGSLNVHHSLNIDGWIRAGSSIDAGQSLSAGQGILAGWNVRAGGNLRTNGEIKSGCRIDAGMNIEAGAGITSACAIHAGGDIRTEKGIDAGSDYMSLVSAIYRVSDDDSETSRNQWHLLQKMWGASSGSQNIWEAITAIRNPFGLEATGSIYAGTSVMSATTIKAGDSIVVAENLEAGTVIGAGGNIVAGQNIKTSCSVSAQGSIQAGGAICAPSINAKTGIHAKGDITFDLTLESGADIAVSGNLSTTDQFSWSTLAAQGEISVGGELRSKGNIRAARVAVSKNLISTGSIQIDGDIAVGQQLVADGHIVSMNGKIQAEGKIKSGRRIQAGQGIQTGTTLESGKDYGIFAATALGLKEWKENGQVIANERPENLMSGYWHPLSN